MDAYVTIIKNASIFMIVAEMLIHLVPSTEYEKYLRFLLDLICIMILFLPIVSTIKKEEFSDYIADIAIQEEALENEIMIWGEKIENILTEHLTEVEE